MKVFSKNSTFDEVDFGSNSSLMSVSVQKLLRFFINATLLRFACFRVYLQNCKEKLSCKINISPLCLKNSQNSITTSFSSVGPISLENYKALFVNTIYYHTNFHHSQAETASYSVLERTPAEIEWRNFCVRDPDKTIGSKTWETSLVVMYCLVIWVVRSFRSKNSRNFLGPRNRSVGLMSSRTTPLYIFKRPILWEVFSPLTNL